MCKLKPVSESTETLGDFHTHCDEAGNSSDDGEWLRHRAREGVRMLRGARDKRRQWYQKLQLPAEERAFANRRKEANV